MTWFSEEMFFSNKCIHGFMCLAFKKFWKVSNVEDLKQNYLTKTPNPTAGGINPSRISPTHIPRIISDMPGKIYSLNTS